MVVISEHKFDMIRRLRVADYLTLSNALCGVVSIFCSLQHRFITAHALIFLGFQFDCFDGIVARRRNECSELGAQLDSLSDLVTFGMAPVVMLYTMGFRTAVDQVVLIFYVLSAVARLARFNVEAHQIQKDVQGNKLYHEGLATPHAALIVSTMVALSAIMAWVSEELLLKAVFLGSWGELHVAMALVFGIATMMLSKRLKVRITGLFFIPATNIALLAVAWSFSPLRLTG